jgi:AcrR family transcriptional regulator
MAGRPRSVSDEQILAATARAISRLGPARLTLAAVAAEAGVAAPTLVQRFGSKRNLLLAFARQAADDPSARFAAARTSSGSAITAVRAALLDMAAGIHTPGELANHLAFLQLELADPEFHQHTLDHANATLQQIKELLDAAVRDGELRPCGTAQLARAIYTTYNGALITWAVHRTGSLTQWLDRELAFLIEAASPRRPASPG